MFAKKEIKSTQITYNDRVEFIFSTEFYIIFPHRLDFFDIKLSCSTKLQQKCIVKPWISITKIFFFNE